MKKIIFITLLLFPLFSISQKVTKWTGKFNLGGAFYSGNVNKTDVKFEGETAHKDSVFEYSTNLKIIYGFADSIENNRELSAVLKFDWKPYYKFSPFLAFTGYSNIYKGYKLRIGAFAGGKYTYFKTDKSDFSISAALSFDYEKYTPDLAGTTLPDEYKIRISVRPRFKQKIGNNLYFEHTTFFKPNLKNLKDYLIESKTIFTNKITKNLAFSISYELEYNSIPPHAELLKLDQAIFCSLEYKF